MKFQQIATMLKRCDIQGGLWIDAGCGNGTFTFPLATLADQVIAIDKNPNNLIPQQVDFNNSKWYEQLVDGILFGFSLHYHPIHQIALSHAFNQLKKGRTIIIIEYASETPVSWVPYPLPEKKLISILTELSFINIQLVESLSSRRKSTFWNNASYILKAEKDFSNANSA